MRGIELFVVMAGLFLCEVADGQLLVEQVAALPVYDAPALRLKDDWLVRRPSQGAGLYRADHANEIVLSNGLLSRIFRLAPNGATVGFEQLTTGSALIRGVKPEAVVEIDGVRHEVGGLKGQPNYAFLRPEWIDALTANPAAFQFSGFEVGPIEKRMEWAEVRRHAPDAAWPPKGVHLRMDYRRTAATWIGCCM